MFPGFDRLSLESFSGESRVGMEIMIRVEFHLEDGACVIGFVTQAFSCVQEVKTESVKI